MMFLNEINLDFNKRCVEASGKCRVLAQHTAWSESDATIFVYRRNQIKQLGKHKIPELGIFDLICWSIIIKYFKNK